mgnify:CR=1 FL=1
MMEKINRTVLKASAGTGKTYRLSLEFIANLIKGTDYRNIVVMTFTKKATAEIKERIYDFLYQIAFEEYNWQDLEKNLREIYELKDFQINKEKLQEIYFNIIRNKDEIRIYTIDGFTNRIFKNTIAPFFGIYNFETLDEEDEEFYGNILGQILENEELLNSFCCKKKMCSSTGLSKKKRISSSDIFFHSKLVYPVLVEAKISERKRSSSSF